MDCAELEDGGISDALLLWSPWHPVPGGSIVGSDPALETSGTGSHGGHRRSVIRTRLFLLALDDSGERPLRGRRR